MINWSLILLTIMFCETGHLSGDDRLNAKGDYWNGKHHSFGCMQIQPDQVIADVNRVYKTSYSHEDCFSMQKSHEIAKLYLSYWIERYELNTGNKATFRDYLQCWNGGCHWYKKTKPEVINKLNKYADKGVKYARTRINDRH